MDLESDDGLILGEDFGRESGYGWHEVDFTERLQGEGAWLASQWQSVTNEASDGGREQGCGRGKDRERMDDG